MFSKFRDETEIKKKYLPIIFSFPRERKPFKSENDISLSPP